jgi:hypothetical protein
MNYRRQKRGPNVHGRVKGLEDRQPKEQMIGLKDKNN